MTKKGNRLTLPVLCCARSRINYYFQYHAFETQGYKSIFHLNGFDVYIIVYVWAQFKKQIILSI